MNHPANNTQSTLSDSIRRKRTITVVGTILAVLVVAEITLQLALRAGWKAYGGDSTVSAIAVDGQGRAWTAGYYRGQRRLIAYSETGKPMEVGLPSELGGGQIISLMIDRQDRVWLGTEGGKIGMLDNNGQWTLYSSITEEDIRQIVMDGQGQVWVRSHRGPAKIDPDSGERTFLLADSALVDHDSMALAIDPQGQVWALTRQRELRVLEADNNWRTVFVAPATVRNGPADSFLTFDPQGQMWMATVQGVGTLSPNGAWKEHPLGDPRSPLSLYELMADAQGRVWVAAFQPRMNNAAAFSGVFRFDPQAGWTSYTSSNSGLSLNADSMALAPGGEVWIGSSYGGVRRFDPRATIPEWSLPAVRRAARLMIPAILLSITFLAIAITTRGKPMAEIRQSPKEILEFSLGFAGWFVIAILLWVFLRYSQAQSAVGLMFFNPLALLVPVVNLVLMTFLYARARRMARGAFSAIVVNSVGMILLLPISVGSVGTALLAAIFMTPFFLSL